MISKKILSAVTAVCLIFGSASVLPDTFFGDSTSITASADQSVSGDYQYKDNGGGTIEIVKYTGKEQTLVMPAAIDGKKITAIGDEAFKNCKTLTSVTISQHVKDIGIRAFFGCTNLTKLAIPRGAESIYSEAFCSCNNLKSVLVPGSITYIKMDAFGYYYDSEGHMLSVKDFLIYCESGTSGYYNAIKNNFDYRIIPPAQRIAGENRFATAAAIADANEFKDTDCAVLAYGHGYADALAGVPLANSLNAPLLLTDKDTVPQETIKEIKSLGAKKIYVLGGTSVISEKAISQLKTELDLSDGSFTRLAGGTRYGTAVQIAEKLSSDPQEIFFVFANGAADALSVSAVASKNNSPIIYLSTNGEIDADTLAYLKTVKGKVKSAYVIGGNSVISDSMMSKAAAALGLSVGTTMNRVAGGNRYSTCTEVNTRFADRFASEDICVAKGLDYPDALAGGTFAMRRSVPMLLADGGLNEDQVKFIQNRKIEKVYVLGGTGAVPELLVNSIVSAAARR